MLKAHQEALAIIKSVALSQKSTGIELKALGDSVGCVLAEDVIAKLDIQPFDNSAMDGFMVLVDSLKNASVDNKIALKNTGLVQAGCNENSFNIENNTCMQVMTGAIVALNAEAVVPIEDVEIKGNFVYFSKPIEKEKNIRRKGQDIKQGELAVAKNTNIEPKHIALLASLGVFELKVYKKPKVLLLSTGNELVAEGKLKIGQIYNSNLHYALAYLKQLGVENIEHKTIKDDEKSFVELIKSVNKNEFNIVISSGAVSQGKFDFVRKGLEQANAKIMYHKLKLRPGKPNLFALLPNNIAYFGLPGNPMANIVGLRFLVSYYLAYLQNKQIEEGKVAICENDFTKKAGFKLFLRGFVKTDENGINRVEIYNKQDSFMINNFSKANCFIIADEEIEKISKGSKVKVYSLLPDFI